MAKGKYKQVDFDSRQPSNQVNADDLDPIEQVVDPIDKFGFGANQLYNKNIRELAKALRGEHTILGSDAEFLFIDGVLVDYTPGSGGTIASGTYTPVASAEANLDSVVTMLQAQYMRVGSTVTVSGRFTANPTTTTTATSFEITLPVASNIGAAEDAAGTAFCGAIAAQGAEIIGVAANNTAKIQWIATDVTNQTWSYTFTYQII